MAALQAYLEITHRYLGSEAPHRFLLFTPPASEICGSPLQCIRAAQLQYESTTETSCANHPMQALVIF
jgi:hypothetical protein